MKGTTRGIVQVILLSLVTCGIYNLYWIAVTHDEVNAYIGEEDMSGAMVVLLSIITCGIYGFVWYYQIGKKLQILQSRVSGGLQATDDSVVYLLLAIFGFGIVATGIIQNNLNRAWQSI